MSGITIQPEIDPDSVGELPENVNPPPEVDPNSVGELPDVEPPSPRSVSEHSNNIGGNKRKRTNKRKKTNKRKRTNKRYNTRYVR